MWTARRYSNSTPVGVLARRDGAVRREQVPQHRPGCPAEGIPAGSPKGSKIEPTTSSPGRKPSPAWRALARRLLRTPTKTHSERPITPISRSSHLIAVHLEHYTCPPTAHAECVAVHRPLDRSVWGRADTEGGGGVPYLSCHLCTLLLKDDHDVSSPTATRPEILCSFPQAGHIDGHQRPVDPVLLRTAAYEHEGYCDDRPRPPHTVWLLRAEGSAVLDPVPEGPERATVPEEIG